jgi:hypothetical protein
MDWRIEVKKLAGYFFKKTKKKNKFHKRSCKMASTMSDTCIAVGL